MSLSLQPNNFPEVAYQLDNVGKYRLALGRTTIIVTVEPHVGGWLAGQP